MKAKLIKVNDYYYLRESYKSDNDGSQCERTLGTTNSQGELGKLSKQNCDEIFGVVDAGKLAEEEIPYSSSTTINVQRMRFIHGFNKAMELNKDKLFTIEDMRKAIITMQVSHNVIRTTKDREELIQSLQQPKEIEVEIEMTCDGVQTGLCMPEICDCNIIPRLDEERCLILKRL